MDLGAARRPRCPKALAYDQARRRLVLFGGLGDAEDTLGDTWLLLP